RCCGWVRDCAAVDWVAISLALDWRVTFAKAINTASSWWFRRSGENSQSCFAGKKADDFLGFRRNPAKSTWLDGYAHRERPTRYEVAAAELSHLVGGATMDQKLRASAAVVVGVVFGCGTGWVAAAQPKVPSLP